MHRTIKPRPHHLRDAARVVAVGLVDLCLQHSPHVSQITGKPASARVLTAIATAAQLPARFASSGSRFLQQNLHFSDDPARIVHNAQARLLDRRHLGELITDINPTQTRVPPFFSNMLPEGPLREYLAGRAGVNPKREFFLLWILGKDLPGAVTIMPHDGNAWPPDAEAETAEKEDQRRRNALRFSLAGIQLKFSAVREGKGLTIPAEGVGGSWIVKLPSMKYSGVPENEYAMMSLARIVGMDIPDIELIEPDAIGGLPDGMGKLDGPALAVRRFDRAKDGPVHIEDFAQVFAIYPDDKYDKASYRNIAEVIWAEVGEEGIAEFIRRVVFNTLIGNADMHVKNWSLIYPDRRSAALAPGYDFVSTIPYIRDDNGALTIGRSKRMDALSMDELAYLAGKARLPEKLVLDTAADTVARFQEAWASEKANLPVASKVDQAIEANLKTIPIARE